ncbi:MAG: hypothetical protein OES47_15010, partial [Acidobacteriota bacterium]|nr:hypothetical protein [Acidobacteriota bacterium]
ETEIDKLRRELARRTKEFSDQEERLKQQIMDLTNREVEHQDRLRTSEHSLRTAATRAQEQEERLAEQERRLVDAGYEQEGLSARLREVSGARESLAVELEALAVTRHDEQAALQAHLEAATAGEADRLRRIEELEGENAAAHRRLEDLEYRETELRKDNEELRGELERVRQALRTTTEDAEREAGSQADWAREVEARQAEIEVLQSDLGQSLEAGRDAEKLLLAELGSARTDYERLEAELHSARSRGSESEATESVLRERLDAALSEVERERENSEKTENELRTELLRAIAQADKMAADGAELGAAVRESESEHHETVQALEAANRGLNAKIARLEEVEPREPQPPTAELLLEPVVPIVEPDIQPDRPDRRWSRIAAVALLGVVAAAAVFLSPMGERLRSAVPSFRAEVVPVATQSVTTDTQQAARRERLGGSEPQLEAGTEPEITTARRESAKEAIAIAETAVLEPGPEISVGLEDEPIGEPAVVVGHWARAWSEQRVEDYLGFYTADFVPANGMSRSEWEAYRRDRLTAPRSISVSLDEIRQETVGEDRVEVVFAQSYNADSYSDRVRKTLLLALETDGWRIAGETAEPIP